MSFKAKCLDLWLIIIYSCFVYTYSFLAWFQWFAFASSLLLMTGVLELLFHDTIFSLLLLTLGFCVNHVQLGDDWGDLISSRLRIFNQKRSHALVLVLQVMMVMSIFLAVSIDMWQRV